MSCRQRVRLVCGLAITGTGFVIVLLEAVGHWF